MAFTDWGCHYSHTHGFDQFLPPTVGKEVTRCKQAGEPMPIPTREFVKLYAQFAETDIVAAAKKAKVEEKKKSAALEADTKSKAEAAFKNKTTTNVDKKR
jgi:hypothetical protein